MITKAKKAIIALSVIWGLISLVLSGVIADESYSGFSIWAFLGSLLAFTFPIWLYWTIHWIFGEGFFLEKLKKIKSSYS